LAVRFDLGLDAVKHAQNSHRRPNAAVASDVVVGAVQLEGAVGSAQCLPVDVVVLELKGAGVLGASGVFGETNFVLGSLAPVDQRQTGQTPLNLKYKANTFVTINLNFFVIYLYLINVPQWKRANCLE